MERNRIPASTEAEPTAISLGVTWLLLVSALAEKIKLTAGVFGHEGSRVLVILNGLRLLRSQSPAGAA